MAKRILGFALVVILSMALFTGCAEKKRCDICGDVKAGKTRTILGQKIFICNDCAKDINELFN